MNWSSRRLLFGRCHVFWHLIKAHRRWGSWFPWSFLNAGCSGFITLSQRQCMQSKHPFLPTPNEAKFVSSARKVMASLMELDRGCNFCWILLNLTLFHLSSMVWVYIHICLNRIFFLWNYHAINHFPIFSNMSTPSVRIINCFKSPTPVHTKVRFN